MPHVTFVHGIGNKIAADALHREWLDELRDADGLDLLAAGVTTSMCYWADVVHEAPVPVVAGLAEEALDEAGEADPLLDEWFGALPPEEQSRVRALAAEVGAEEALGDPAVTDIAGGGAGDPYERIPLPGPVKRRLMGVFLREVHHYLWDTEVTPRQGQTFQVRTEVRRRAVAAMREATSARPHVLVGHSLGSVIAYDVLCNDPSAPEVDGLLTLGSPLGLDEVQDRLTPGWSRHDGFPSAAMSTRSWVNVFDRRDPVCGLDPQLANDFRWQGHRVVVDIEEPNWGAWRHAIAKYLHGPRLRESLAVLLEIS